MVSKTEVTVKGQSKLFAFFATLIIAACSSDSAKTLGEISFDDEFIENCVYQRQWHISPDGSLQHVHSVKGPDGVYYVEAGETPLTGVTEVRACDAFNSFDGRIPDMPYMASHLRDLTKLPYLKHLALDFNVGDFSALPRLDQVETLEIPQVYGVDSPIYPDLREVAEMNALQKLMFYGDLYSDFSALNDMERLTSLQLGLSTPRASKLISDDLPASLKSLTLWNTWFADAADYQALDQLDEFVLVAKSYYWDEADELVEPDYRMLADFENLNSLKLKFTSFDDLSVLSSLQLETLNLTMTNEVFRRVDWSTLESLDTLSNLLVVSYDEPSDDGSFRVSWRTFHTRYYDSEKALAGEYGDLPIADTLLDTMYAVLGMTEQQAAALSDYYQLEQVVGSLHYDSIELNTYIIRDLNHDLVLELFQHWLDGNITTFK